jgi:RNA polymerase primary sigma factor
MRQLKISKTITNRESQSLEKYLQEIAKLPLISTEEEVRLFEWVKKGNLAAKEKLVKANLRFVVSVAKQFQGQGLSLPDLINEGNLGLIKSIDRFDPTRGFKFISFAVWWIRQSIIQSIADQSRMVRIPLNKVILGGKINKVKSALEQELGRTPSEEEIAEAMQIETGEVGMSLGINNRHISFDAPGGEEEETTLLDSFVDPTHEAVDKQLVYRESLKTELTRSFTLLTERQKEMLCCFFGIGHDHAMSLDEIGRKFNLTPERVRQIKDKALMKLRTQQNQKLLFGFLRA